MYPLFTTRAADVALLFHVKVCGAAVMVRVDPEPATSVPAAPTMLMLPAAGEIAPPELPVNVETPTLPPPVVTHVAEIAPREAPMDVRTKEELVEELIHSCPIGYSPKAPRTSVDAGSRVATTGVSPSDPIGMELAPIP
jgi:hypothetical protein